MSESEMEQRCPQCASLRLTRVRNDVFMLEWRCGNCGHVFLNPLLSVVILDGNDQRREELVSCLQSEGIPVIAAASVAELEGWPVGKVLVANVDAVTPLWLDMGAAHMVVLADSEQERARAAEISHARATVADGKPAALLASLRTVANAIATALPDGPAPDRRTGPRERRRHPRRDRRS